MKLVSTSNTDIMEVTEIRVEDGKLIVSGTIMGAMPIEAVLVGAEMRKGYAMLSLGTLWQIFKIFLAGKAA